ncbi:MAG: HlyD family secretion protein [Burkholderiales bacterium]|nr:HlyD family secretion protein [Burkholderiales bacterium]
MKVAGRRIVQGLAIVAVLGAAAAGYAWYRESLRVRSTDDAYVNADVARISALVTGQVARVFVKDNQEVRKGDELFELDRRPFEVALAKARAKLAQAERTARQDSADVGAAQAGVESARVALDNANAQLKRAEDLVAQKFLSQQALDDARAKARTAEASLAAAQAMLDRARQAVTGGVAANPDALEARAEIAQAQLDVERTRVIAPSDGRITNFSLVAGSSVTANAPVAALIVDGSFWVDANFKETELPGIRPGQRAQVSVDMVPGRVFHGHVDSLSGGTGSAFSLLPPQNATGNWVKVTQRIPVKVRIDDTDPAHPLRVGATATVEIRVD